MNKVTRINPKKLRHSKWTAVTPQNKEKHFMVIEVEFDEEGAVVLCLLIAVYSEQEYSIDWRELKNTEVWLQGWQ